ncbi:MAG TPA: pyridoxal phosphate-dependent aminotransferase [Candidatus Sulfotelmatobacter sp.]|nr:pyridoxal phosphate-dependent aminotransferase [Candidatus Sulfotelmatobacter sp.]
MLRPDIAALPGSRIAAIADYGRDRAGLIPLWFGESDLPTPRFIQEAATAAMAAGHMRYTAKRGVPELRQTLADYLTALYGRAIDMERIQVTASGMSAIMVALQCLVEPGRSVVAVSPVWPNANAATRVLGGTVREVALDAAASGERTLDLDRLFGAIDATTVALFVNSPGNPTGWVLDPATMTTILDECRRRGVWIIADEVYGRIAFDADVAPSFLECAEPDDRLIVINSFSKAWCMTGWRLGWLTVPPALLPYLEKINEFNTSGAADFTQRAGVVALRDGEAFVADLRAMCRINRDRVFDRLAQLPRVRIGRPRAGFYAFFSVDGEPDSEALARRLIDQAAVGLAPGAAFGAGGEGHLRLCFASATATIEAALDRLVPALR